MLLLGCDCTCTIRVMAGAAGAVEVWWVGHGVGDSATTFVIVQGEVAALALVKARSLPTPRLARRARRHHRSDPSAIPSPTVNGSGAAQKRQRRRRRRHRRPPAPPPASLKQFLALAAAASCSATPDATTSATAAGQRLRRGSSGSGGGCHIGPGGRQHLRPTQERVAHVGCGGELFRHSKAPTAATAARHHRHSVDSVPHSGEWRPDGDRLKHDHPPAVPARRPERESTEGRWGGNGLEPDAWPRVPP